MNETYVTISGNVVGDPQVRMTRANVPFVTFRVASNVRRVDYKTGEYIDAGTNFVNVTAFRLAGRQPGQLAGEGAAGDRLRPDADQPVDQRRPHRHDGRDRRLQRRARPHPRPVDLRQGGAPQLDQHDRLADPVVQQAGEALDGSPRGRPRDRADEAAYGLGLAGAGDEGGTATGERAGSAGFDVEAADTDDYEVVGAASH